MRASWGELSVTDADAGHERARLGGVDGEVWDEFMGTGAVVAGRGTFEPAGGWGGDHHDGVPIFVLSRREPGIDLEQWPLVTYVNDITTAMSEAKRAAGDKNVLVHGAATAQLALAAGLLDELEIHLIPVLLGQGRRLFDNLDPDHIELARTRVLGGTVSPTCTTGSGSERSARARLHHFARPCFAHQSGFRRRRGSVVCRDRDRAPSLYGRERRRLFLD